ncbi:MAG: Terminase-like family protein [Euryarchaeota archaeon]|nr:Terminase-like family protein [Euryarchaeota archaeon]
MLSRDLKAALDPVAWCREALDLEPDPWQAEVLRSDSKRILLNCSRQSGKSTVTSILALHTATYQDESLVLCLSPTLRQSSELFRNVSRFYGVDPAIPSRSESALRLELENGSRIVSLPGKEQNIRGMAKVSLLIVDEAARVPDSLYYSVRPMLAVSNGRLIALSTPFGNRGWWAEAWHSSEAWQKWEIPASKCPRIPAAFLDEEKRVLGSYWFEQEYNCKFLDSQTQVFRREDVDAMFTEKVQEWTI